MEPLSIYYKKSSIKPLPSGGGDGRIYFKHIGGRILIETGGHLREEINRDRGAYLRRGDIYLSKDDNISSP